MAISLYLIQLNAETVESTEFLIKAKTAKLAAEIYISMALNDQLPIDLEELCEERDLGLKVANLSNISLSEAGLVRWGGVDTIMFDFEDLDAWNEAVAKGFDSETGEWDECPDGAAP